MTIECLQVLTSKTMSHLKRLGGSGSWSLDPAKVKTKQWVICFHIDSQNNDHRPFLIGEVGPIVVSPEWDRSQQRNIRYLIKFERVALIQEAVQRQSSSWRELAKGRNPIRYGTVEEVLNGVSIDSLDFITGAEWRGEYATLEDTGLVGSADSNANPGVNITTPVVSGRNGISVEDAKRELAARYNVSTESIEITIKF